VFYFGQDLDLARLPKNEKLTFLGWFGKMEIVNFLAEEVLKMS